MLCTTLDVYKLITIITYKSFRKKSAEQIYLLLDFREHEAENIKVKVSVSLLSINCIKKDKKKDKKNPTPDIRQNKENKILTENE